MTTSLGPVLIAAGGTGGHVFPALAVADVLRGRDVPVEWIGTRRGLEATVVPAAGLPIHWVSVAGLRGKGLWGTISGPFLLAAAIIQSLIVVAKLKPRAVLGMGGFVTGPVGIAAKLMGKKLVLHEQNAVAGLTNRQLSRFASTVFSAMPNAFAGSSNAIVVGNPLRREIEAIAYENVSAEAEVKNNLNASVVLNNDHDLHVLVVGGSQGAQVLNNVIPEVVNGLNFSIKLVHQTGFNMYESVQDRYASHTEKTYEVEVQKFIDNMTDAYLWADLVVCRSGAMTVSELAAMSLPSVLVPFPHAVDDHQTKNAKYLEDAGACVLIPQEKFTVSKLTEVLTELHTNRALLQRMSQAARTCFKPAAAEKVADALSNSIDNVISSNHEVSA